MLTAIKCALAIFMVVGTCLAIYGVREILATSALVGAAVGKAQALFAGYHREYRKVPSGISLKGSATPSVASYAEFTIQNADGAQQRVREPKMHIFAAYEPGPSVEVLLFADQQPRLAGFYSLFALDLLILAIGIGFCVLAALFWRYALPGLAPADLAVLPTAPSAGPTGPSPAEINFHRFLDQKIGPVSAKLVLMIAGIVMGAMLLVGLGAALAPYVAHTHLGPGLFRDIEHDLEPCFGKGWLR